MHRTLFLIHLGIFNPEFLNSGPQSLRWLMDGFQGVCGPLVIGNNKKVQVDAESFDLFSKDFVIL